MPYKDPEKRRQAERERQRRRRAGAVQMAAGDEEKPFDPLPPQPTVADLTGAVAAEINHVRAAKADTLARARTVGYLAGVLLKALEVGEIERRLEAIEETLLKNGK